MTKQEKINAKADFRDYIMMCRFEKLNELLIKKGILTKEEVEEMLAKADLFAVTNYGKGD
jgi:hypothetical protein